MPDVKKYLPILLSSFVSLVAIMALVALIKPDFFSLVPGAVPKSARKVDSLKVKNDSTTIGQKKDSVHIPEPAVNVEPDKSPDTTMTVESALAKAGVKIPSSATPLPDTLSETEKRKMAQIFESMDAESAAKILNKMDDEAVRKVIAIMKRRQSAKILAALDPQQAARLLKGKIE